MATVAKCEILNVNCNITKNEKNILWRQQRVEIAGIAAMHPPFYHNKKTHIFYQSLKQLVIKLPPLLHVRLNTFWGLQLMYFIVERIH